MDLMDAAARFIEATRTEEMREILEDCPALLQEDGVALVRLMTGTEGSDASSPLADPVRILERCRKMGVNRVLPPPPPPRRPPTEAEVLVRVAHSQDHRWRKSQDPAALDDLAAAWMAAWNHPGFKDLTPPLQINALLVGGEAWVRRFFQRRDLADLDQAIATWRSTLSMVPERHPQLAAIHNNLGNALRERHIQSAEPADLDQAIDHYERSLHLATGRMSPGDLDKARHRWSNVRNLALALLARADAADLDRAIGMMFDLVVAVRRHRIPPLPQVAPGLGFLASLLQILGRALCARARRAGDEDDLDRAILALEEACRLTQLGSPAQPNLLRDLADAHAARGRGDHDTNRSALLAGMADWVDATAPATGSVP